MTVAVKHVYTAENLSAINPTISVTGVPANGDVLVLISGDSAGVPITAVSGCGATWTKVSGFTSTANVVEAFVGTGATSSGTVTATTASTSPRTLEVLMVSGLSSGTAVGVTVSGTGTQTTPAQTAGPGQLVIGAGWSDNSTDCLTAQTPATGWTVNRLGMSGSTLFTGVGYRIPDASASHTTAANRTSNNNTFVSQLVLGDPNIKALYSTVGVATANPTVTVTQPVVAGDVLLLFATWGTANKPGTAVSGCGATWTKVANTLTTVSEVWIGRGATSTGTVTYTAVADSFNRTLNVYHVANTTSTVVGAQASPGTGTATSSPVLSAGNGQIVFGTAYTLDSTGGISGLTPSDGWTQIPTQNHYTSRYWAQVYRVPSATANNSFTATYYMQEVVLGDIVATAKTISSALSGTGTLTATLTRPARTIASALSGSGALTSALSRSARTISSALSGSGTLSSTLQRTIASALSGAGTLSSTTSRAARTIASGLSGSGTLGSALVRPARTISSDFSGSGTLVSHLGAVIQSSFSGTGTLASALSRAVRTLDSVLSGTGTLSSTLALIKRIDSAFEGSGTLTSTIGVPVPPAPTVEGSPLGKLASFTISTAAVKLNPAEGSGATPSVSAVYTKGSDPEFALGETNVLTNGAVGTYEGEIVRLNLPANSGNASISTNTPLTSLNTEMQLRPFIDSSPGTWTAVRAIDYWTQQAGLFYDKVPGECIAYASGFGHTDCYGASTTGRFYEKLNTGTTDTQVINDRSVKTFGADVIGTTAFHEVKGGVVIASLPLGKKFIFSIGVGLAGTGRTATALWQFRDSKNASHTVGLVAGSDGTVTATLGGATIASASVPVNATYRLTLSLEKLDGATVSAKLTVHTDDLAGNGTLQYDGAPATASYALPGVLKLWGIQHVSAGGSGSQMTRWGTYMSVADSHPTELPAVQKVLAQTGKDFAFVSGFFGNVWNLLNEFCTIARLDLRFTDAALQVSRRISTLSPVGVWATFTADSQRREKFKQVAVVNKQSKAVSTDDAVLWRSDSVIQVNAREVYQTTVTTPHSILRVLNPVAVSGIEPFPYVKGGGQYVVTGADGYIVAPGWWNDNGGKVEVSLTDKEGEIAIKITAPAVDTVRAPYRISEGAADRPALYVCGSGIVNDPKEIHVTTGAKNAREGFDNVFDSPFVSGLMETYDTAMAMASVYSSGVAEVTYELPNTFETPSGLGQYPAGALVTDNSRNYRIMDASQTASRVSGTAVPHTTIGAYVASYPAGATIADEKARHAGRTIRQFNIKPLKGNS